MAQNIDLTCVTAAELADGLLHRDALSALQAHDIATKKDRNLIDRGVPLSQEFDTSQSACKRACGRTAALNVAAFAQTTSPAAFIARRNRFGGPAPAALDAAFHRNDYELAESIEVNPPRAAFNDLLAT